MKRDLRREIKCGMKREIECAAPRRSSVGIFGVGVTPN